MLETQDLYLKGLNHYMILRIISILSKVPMIRKRRKTPENKDKNI